MEHKLPDLPFAENSLENYISSETIGYHYGKHHRAYVDNLNKLIKDTEFEDISLEEIISTSQGGIFNNAAQVWNHTFYWNCLSPIQSDPLDEIEYAIKKGFQTITNFKEQFVDIAMKLFGSGWVWLLLESDGSLAIEAKSNAGNPIVEGKKALLVCDVWEHAYYIDYRNARAKYIEAFWKLINWQFVNNNLK